MPNPGLSRTRPYPFARLRKLFEGIVPAEGKLEPISLGIGEPCHPIPPVHLRCHCAKRFAHEFLPGYGRQSCPA